LTVSTVEAAVAAKEARRWVVWLGGSMLGACVFVGLALAGVSQWMILPAILVGPGFGGIALIWLALSSDTNRLPAAARVEDAPAIAVAAEAAA
jgi:hypothetical protein